MNSAVIASQSTVITRVDPERTAVHRPLLVDAHGLTDRGRVRPNNEDQFLVAELTKALRLKQSSLPRAETQFSQERGHLFLVADGMGGHTAGERASALAVQSIQEFVLNTLKWFFDLRGPEGDTVVGEFQEALRRADARLLDEVNRHPELRGMGTTVTMAYQLSTALFIVHVGDSRCYLLRRGEMVCLTRDHTLVAEWERQGVLSAEEAARHRLRHVIVNVVGGHEPGVEVEVHKVGLEPGDRILLCTDGLSEMVPHEMIAAALAEAPDARAACERLVAAANERGGRDNVTAVVARFTAPEGRA